MSRGWQGRYHDYRQLKYHFPPDQPWFSELSIELDLGYQGVLKDYVCQAVSQPAKKPKGGELTLVAKISNGEKSRSRVRIEHAIGGLKRYRYLSDRLRTRKVILYESSLLICAGLWNFILTN
ncbi:transposase family protein [Spirosoma terrae]